MAGNRRSSGGYLSAPDWLMENGADVSDRGWTPEATFPRASFMDEQSFDSAVSEMMKCHAQEEGDKCEKLALETLKNHGDLNQPDKNGDTLLIKLIRYGREETALKLIRAGANVNVKGMFGCTALHAACSRDTSEEIIEELIAHKADINAQNVDGETPLMDAVYRGEEKAVEILLKHNANTSLTESNKKTVFIIPRYKKSDKIEQMLKKVLLEQKKEAHRIGAPLAYGYVNQLQD